MHIVQIEFFLNFVHILSDNLVNKQTELDTKLEKVLTEVEEIKDISKVARNISFEVSNCTESLISSRNVTHPKAGESSGIFETGGEITCTDLSKTLSSIVKAMFHINSSQHEYAISNVEKCWKDLPETMLGHTYFLTPKLKQKAAAKYCKDHGGKPFIPKTEDEFLYYVAMTVEPETDKYSWYPVNDIEEDGHAVLEDGTDYEKASYKLQKWDPKRNNSIKSDCVRVNIFGEGSWLGCRRYDYVLLCQGN
ncbi:UNVERIFIED_CONTAM: hypothetical protein RMT77_019625 [Armadillidium vulgare]